MTPEIRTVLERTRELLRSTRWDPTACARDAAGNPIGAVWPAASYSLCGAVTHACAGAEKLDCKITIDVLGSSGLSKPEQLTHWENAPGRTLEEVIGLLDRALVVHEPAPVASKAAKPVLMLVPGGATDEEPSPQKGLFE